MQQGFWAVLPRFQSPSSEEEERLLCGFALIFGQTRSGSGNTKASGQVLPLFRAFFQSLLCYPQARLRTFPGYLVPGTRGNIVCSRKESGQKRGVQITLHRTYPTLTVVNPLREGLAHRLATAMAKLRE